MRTIKLKLLTQQDLVVVTTDATTFGQFKQEAVVEDLMIDWSSAKLIDRATRTSFDMDESVLPSTDSIMFVTPTKTKSGGDLSYKDAKEEIINLVGEGSIKPINWMGKTTKDLNLILNEFYNKPSSKSGMDIEDNEEVLEEVSNEDVLIAELSSLLKKAGKKLKNYKK